MRKPLFDPDVADVAPTALILTGYDEERLPSYGCSMLRRRAPIGGKSTRAAHRPREGTRVGIQWTTHLARAGWMTTSRYHLFLPAGLRTKPSQQRGEPPNRPCGKATHRTADGQILQPSDF